MRAAHAILDDGLREMVSVFRALQDPSGCVTRDEAGATRLLSRMTTEVARVCSAMGQEPLADAFAEDAGAWSARGLATVPDFSRVRETYAAPQDGRGSFFIGAVLAQNGPTPRGMFLEYFLTLGEAPPVVHDLARQLPHPVAMCQSTRLSEASPGFGTGNCIVFFPEYIAAATPTHHQSYAVFFFNKFQRIYLVETLPIVRRLLGGRDVLFGAEEWLSASLGPRECYEARCVWGYLHDYFHHQGPRPLHHNLQLKQRYVSCSLLEELRADCTTALFLFDQRTPYWREVIEFFLFERLFRYPMQPDRATNFDSGTGFFLFEWMRRHGALAAEGERLAIGTETTIPALRALVDEIHAAESLGDDEAYVARCASLVREMIPRSQEGDAFLVPRDYSALPLLLEPHIPLDMSALPY